MEIKAASVQAHPTGHMGPAVRHLSALLQLLSAAATTSEPSGRGGKAEARRALSTGTDHLHKATRVSGRSK